MAKQSGLHQIRGKVGEHSYYKQTGVSAGLIRSINQGLSARVKDGEEFANTRLNNAEFGAACNVAGSLGKMVTPKFRPMILPFSQSKMARKVLELARLSAAAWGQRTVMANASADLAEILSEQSKRDAEEFVSLSVGRGTSESVTLTVSYTAEQATLMASLGINKLTVVAASFDLATGKYGLTTHKIAPCQLTKTDGIIVLDGNGVVPGSGDSASEDLNVTASFNPPTAIYNGQQLVVGVVLPIRSIADVDHILQEYCSFKAFATPAYNP